MICKWPRDCAHCTARIEEGDDLHFVCKTEVMQ